MTVMDRVNDLTKQAREWYEHSPTAQRAYARFREDVSAVAERAAPTVNQVWERIGPLIDPPAKTEGPKDAP